MVKDGVCIKCQAYDTHVEAGWSVANWEPLPQNLAQKSLVLAATQLIRVIDAVKCTRCGFLWPELNSDWSMEDPSLPDPPDYDPGAEGDFPIPDKDVKTS